ncbi:uncharacterized protein LOC118736352 [Rhagoletis pomonella]|uniref:uncharacterized protein LOC118736352 n=1 Tax=Rhagoletis pomonella TaxID=28610 RepID=UPI001785EE0B|nr:uncharacterized protein LOC118736352 [Rhagoletis pomonella]
MPHRAQCKVNAPCAANDGATKTRQDAEGIYAFMSGTWFALFPTIPSGRVPARCSLVGIPLCGSNAVDTIVSRDVVVKSEMRELVPPIMNEKATSIVARLGDPVVVPYVAYANPKPVYR